MNKTNKEYLTVLKDFSEQLKTQSYDGNTERLPTYWMVQKRDRVWHIDPYEADGVLMGFYGEEKVPVEDFKASVEERIKETFEDPDKVTDYCDELEGLMDFDEIKNFCDEIRDYYAFGTEWEVELIGYNVRWRDVRNEMFLTKRDAKEYIRKFDYRFTDDEKPLRTYAYVAEDSPDLTALINALKNIDWDNIKVVDNDYKPLSPKAWVKITDSDGYDFIVSIPANINKDDLIKIGKWLDDVLIKGSWYSYNLFYALSASYYDRVITMDPKSDNAFNIYIKDRFHQMNTDDAIYEWVSERFENTNYIIV